ncbi:septal ring lytic transglycosylase RlpA family protein [Pedosphaera parvula]|uniref:Rare lipoprotein A n=1 Tax=Pedosphaera parvula (strain Ellin514) TaxID=320771 RepID=B9X9S6_PEDPL|nr:septal ring lytic transglycosylase RlpA family protein [Pedosphaera parvula]EEF63227.1 Rare lipoprotein A [Pedosphaera parvula Ellin514]
MKVHCIALALLAMATFNAGASQQSATGFASWYGEDHRGRLMANGKKFDPDRLTAASWFYPLGTRVRVTTYDVRDGKKQPRSVLVTITDRGPAKDLVRDGRIIDLGHAAFKALADPDQGLVSVKVQPLKDVSISNLRAMR